MVVAAYQKSSVALNCRAGKTLTWDITVYETIVSDDNFALWVIENDIAEPTTDADYTAYLANPRIELDLSTYTGRLQVRDLRGRTKVLINAGESGTANAPLRRVSKGTWRIFLGKSYTSWLPHLSQFEVDITNGTVAEDVLLLLSGTVSITPEGTSGG